VGLFLAAALGALGALLHDGFELGEVLRSRRNDVPEEWRTAAFLVATALRVAAGAGLAALLAFYDQVGPLGAVFVGILGPPLLQRGIEAMNRPPRGV
jgi:hypothetical protein